MKIRLALAIPATAFLIGGCGSSGTHANTSDHSGGSSSQGTTSQATTRPPAGECSNAQNCNTDVGQLISGLTLSNPSNVQATLNQLHAYFFSRASQALTPIGARVQRVECAPMGDTGQFPSDDYMCSGLDTNSAGQQQYIAPAVLSLATGGQVSSVGSPCNDSYDVNGCGQKYWNLVESQLQP
jgi:hypothetical protein